MLRVSRRKRRPPFGIELTTMNLRIGIALLIAVAPQTLAAATNLTLTWIRGSSVKVEQMIGGCDYSAQAATGQCKATTSTLKTSGSGS